MLNARRSAFVAAQWILAAAVVWFAVRSLSGQWAGVAARMASLRLDWTWIGLASILVLLTYVLLIETWRRMIEGAGEQLPVREASRIWFVSNLGKYVPGKVWSIAAMTVMARNSGVSPVVAAGSSVVVQLVTVAVGIGVVLVSGAQAIQYPQFAIVAALGIIAFLAFIPALLQPLGRSLAAVTGRPIVLPRVPARVVWMAVAATVVSWISYGIAFQLFVKGVLGSAAGATSSYIAVYAASYIIGFLALFAPGGAVVREGAMVTGMVLFGLSGHADALTVAVASRLWLTFTELLPGLLYMVAGKRKTFK